MSGWSGLTYFIRKSLEDSGNQLTYINSFKAKKNLILKIKEKIYPKLTGKFIQAHRYPSYYKQIGKQIDEKLRQADDFDFIFSNSSEPIAACTSKTPKAFWVDASFAGILNYYPEFDIVHPETIRRANELEQLAYDKSSVIFFASDWAAETALKNYKIDERKVKVVPFGANISTPPKAKEIELVIQNKRSDKLILLFAGVYWERKGGPLAVQIVEKLNQINIPAELIIVGCSPFDNKNKPEFVRQLGFLSKSDMQQKQLLDSVYKESHFLLVPTKAECYGLVYCEANAFGLPAIATNTGGIPTIIKNDINGYLFSDSSSVDDYCNVLQKYYNNDLYQQLACSSFKEFSERLNWDVAGKAVSNYLHSCI